MFAEGRFYHDNYTQLPTVKAGIKFKHCPRKIIYVLIIFQATATLSRKKSRISVYGIGREWVNLIVNNNHSDLEWVSLR